MIWAKITTIFDIRKFYELNFAKIKISGVTRLSALNKDGVFLFFRSQSPVPGGIIRFPAS